jgi:hypothetical protein
MAGVQESSVPIGSVTKDLVELLETRLWGGKVLARAILYAAALALLVGLVLLLFTSAKAFLGILPTSIPIPLEPADYVSLVVVVGLFAAVMYWTNRQTKRLSLLQDATRQVFGAEAELHTNTMDRVHRLEERATATEEELKRFMLRFDYIESKVGNELHDFLVRRLLERKGWLIKDKAGNLVANPQMSDHKDGS